MNLENRITYNRGNFARFPRFRAAGYTGMFIVCRAQSEFGTVGGVIFLGRCKEQTSKINGLQCRALELRI